MKHLTLFEQFTNESKDAKKVFQSLKKGDKVRYMGYDHVVVKADGVIAKLEDENGKFYTINFNQFRGAGELLEGKPAGAPDFHDSEAPDAHGKFKDLSVKDLAKWLIDTRNGDVKKISASLTQQIVFNRNDNPEYADKMEKTRQEVYKQLGREDLLEGNAKPGPDKYMTGLDDKEEEKKEDQIKKQREMDDDDSDAYKEMPGDKEAREEGRVKTSKHVKKYHELYGDEKNESVINEEKAEGDRSPIDNADIEKALKKKSDETGVPIGLIRIIMRRGMAAWKTGHRPGAGQEQWGYARVNSFLTKGDGTWGDADKDVAKEVRDGGYDSKLKS